MGIKLVLKQWDLQDNKLPETNANTVFRDRQRILDSILLFSLPE